ncbi:MAG TPA: histidine kinase, partial [Bacteroidia bacterium]|nr:histidine kinase [Bacteroidia bacterium]
DNERKRVASELHDDLGAGLSTIRLLSELALQKTEGKTEIKRISELSNELVDSMRQIIWSMNPESSSLSDFIHYLKRYTMEIIELNGKIFNFKLNQEISDYTLSPEQKRNLFLIIKETLHNSIKHSKSNEIILIYDYIEKRHHLTIKDNGIGFSPDDINYKNGNGLINIQKRAMQIGCSVFVTSEITKGTITRIEFS